MLALKLNAINPLLRGGAAVRAVAGVCSPTCFYTPPSPLKRGIAQAALFLSLLSVAFKPKQVFDILQIRACKTLNSSCRFSPPGSS